MLTEYSLEEKREFLRLSRIRLDIDTKHPREKATDAIVERGIFGCSVHIEIGRYDYQEDFMLMEDI